MRYTILRPPAPLDPRHLDIRSAEHLRELAPSIHDCDLEREAAERVRELYPDAVAMPIPLKIGSGETILLGILPSIEKVTSPEFKIGFVLFVQAIGQYGGDTAIIKRGGQFSRALWKAPVLKAGPDGPDPHDWTTVSVELRGTNIEQPLRLEATAFRRTKSGNIVLFLSLPDVEMSLELLEPMPVLPINVADPALVPYLKDRG